MDNLIYQKYFCILEFVIVIIYYGVLMRDYDTKSNVENIFLKKSNKRLFYKQIEKIGIVQVNSYSELGKLTALRFIEWLQLNPRGVVSLPTGKTPKSFIQWTSYFLKNWNTLKVKDELKKYQIDINDKPNLKTYTFIQIDEYFPIHPEQQNSFYYFIKKFYFNEIGFDFNNAVLMDVWHLGRKNGENLGDVFSDYRVDLTLKDREAQNSLEEKQKKILFLVDEYCCEYEKKIFDLGGIGFFLGGIGLDGHIGFDIKGSEHNSITRILKLNYKSAAVVAKDFGGFSTF